jgi:ribosomal-protein-alanine N-acetyltransferase
VHTPSPFTSTDEAVRIRPCERGDILEVLRIEQRVFKEPWPYEAFDQCLEQSGFLVAVHDGGAVGYIIIDVMSNQTRNIGHIKDIAVDPAFHRQGIGRRLLLQAIQYGKVNGADVIKLEVRASNDPAISLYVSHGFGFRRRVPRYYADGEDALVLDMRIDN